MDLSWLDLSQVILHDAVLDDAIVNENTLPEKTFLSRMQRDENGWLLAYKKFTPPYILPVNFVPRAGAVLSVPVCDRDRRHCYSRGITCYFEADYFDDKTGVWQVSVEPYNICIPFAQFGFFRAKKVKLYAPVYQP